MKFDRLTTEYTISVKGLSQNSVYCLFQDAKGFIWIGTWDGLNKYNGYDFTIYDSENGLSNTTVNTLLEDTEKYIWIGTESGLNKFDRKTETFKHFFNKSDNPNSLSANFINHLCLDKQGNIWIGTSFGLNRYDKNLEIFKTYNFFERGKDSLKTNFISRIMEDTRGWLWIGTQNGVHCYDPEQLTFYQYKFDKGKSQGRQSLPDYITDIVEDEHGIIYAATKQGLYFINPLTHDHGPFKPVNNDLSRLSDLQINTIHIDDEQLLWIGTAEGLYIFDPSMNNLRCYKSGGSSTTLSNDDIRCIYQDQSGTIWVGTYKGLNKVDQSSARFTHYYFDPANPLGLSDNIVYSIMEDERGMVWIGTYEGVNIYDRVQDRFTWIKNDPANPASLSSNKIRALTFDRNGYVWIGTESSGLNRLNRTSGHVTRYAFDLNDSLSLCDNFIVSMLTDSKGRVWIGTAMGINLADANTGFLQRLSGPPYNIKLRNEYICSIYEDREGNFWVGTLDGLHKLTPDLKQVTIYLHDPENPNSMCPNRVFSTYQDHNGIYWFGTMGAGLVRFDPADNSFSSLTQKDGLPNNVVYAILEDDEGSFWISTNNGLTRFYPQSRTFVNYDTRDGIQGNEFNGGAYFKNTDGVMYFGGMNGFNVFHPGEIFLNLAPPRMVFTKFNVLNETIDNDLEGGELFYLSYLENVFSVEFSALDYTNPQKNQYRYKLENYDEGWVFAGAGQRRANYRNVPPGTYRFVVTGSNNDGIWNTTGINVTIVIRPPWWKTNLFRISAFILTVGLLWSLIYIRMQNLKRKTETEKKMLVIEKQVFEMEQKALQLQMNPHFIFNSLNAIQNFILASDTDKAVDYLVRFSQLMRMILANSSVPIISLKDELKSLTLYLDLEKLRFDNKFEYFIQKDPSLDEEFVMIPPMLLQPFVENAVIHGFISSPIPGRLDISFKHIPQGSVLCVIQDNGIGREQASAIRAASGIKRKPRGLTITQERIDILRKQRRKNYSVVIHDLKNENGEPLGTRVEITIQYKET